MERRKGPDFLNLWIKYSSIFLWVLIFVYFMITDSARPEQVTFFDRLLSVPRENLWDVGLLTIAFIVALILLFLSVISLVMNSRRLKRKSDRVRLSLVLHFIFSVLFIIVLSIRLFL